MKQTLSSQKDLTQSETLPEKGISEFIIVNEGTGQ